MLIFLHTFLCPKCQEDIQLPDGGLTQLKKNFDFSKANDINTQQQERQALEEEQTNVAQGTAQKNISCEKHPNNELKFYCDDDDIVICGECIATGHGGHRISSVDKAAKSNRDKIKSQPPLAEQGTNPKSAAHSVFLEKAECVHSFSAKLKNTRGISTNGLAIHEEQVFFLDCANSRTKMFTHTGVFKFDIPLSRPFDLAMSQTGHLYITSQGDSCVQVYSTRGQQVSTMGQSHLGRPYGITLNKQGHVMVCDMRQKSIFTFHDASDKLLNTIPLSMCTDPWYITVNSVNDNIVISDAGSHCVYVLSPTGDQLYQYGTQGRGDGQLWGPRGVCTDRHGHIFIADCFTTSKITKRQSDMAKALAAAFTDNLLTCNICLEEYEDPRVLPCNHTFCYGCISSHAQISITPNLTFLCPNCREEIKLPDGGLTQLKKNFAFSKAKDIITQQQERQTLEEEQTNVASVAQGTAQKNISCKKHPNNELKFYCDDDDTVICGECIATEHGGHRISPVDKATKSNRDKTESQPPLARQGTNPKSVPHPSVFLEKAECVHSFSAKLKNTRGISTNGLAIDEEQVFVLDCANSRTKMFTHTGVFKFDIQLSRPFDVAMSQTGHLYVTSQGDSCVQVYSTRGQQVTTMGQSHLGRPCGITLNRQGHMMVSDTRQKSIFTFHDASGHLLNTIPLSMCRDPWYITVNSVNDNIVISDAGSHCVYVLSPTGDQLYQYGTQGRGDGQLWGPRGVCTDRRGHIFIADCFNRRIVALSPQGQFIRYIVTEDDGLQSPMAVAINPAGQLVVAEDGGKVKTFQYIL
ncbi:uncharacterized protein LOC112042305 [Lingula anatina]|uniref:Uncharacterized protein LOC112042305 n=1 Tax=Lingula anatina TaxID=7574 RepID=A0A2R2MQ93_LINAN|nr:uncharacterized protein LOC112042305 [Lingula anatina]|eukprot:XP_023932415.1 uncharacterized protein LOC112042305 [Lingula anatina]